MFNPSKIEEIAKVSKAERWPFPKTLTALKEAGVAYYDVDLMTYEIIYHGDGKSLKQSGVLSYQQPPKKGPFDKNALFKAITKHQTEKTSYSDCMKEVIEAGIVSYRVDIIERTCSYFGSSEGESYVEKFP
ncbi:MAG: DUF1398 family protein [Verrucomicrobia bacterium]|nr:DUF1398 family protein [Verrucomicrobiota bacterium]